VGQLGDMRGFETLVGTLAAKNREDKKDAAKALGLLKDSRACEPLTRLLTDQERMGAD